MTPTPPATVAVATFRRNALLEVLLPRLVEQCAEVPGAEILVIDNDPQGLARTVVEPWLTSSAGAVRYVHEPEPGISAARNRALTEAAHPLVVFIDDDEIPRASWLRLLLETRDAHQADAVTGPVLARFESTPEPWVVGTGVFERITHRTGQLVRGAATNNLLLDRDRLAALGLRFDPAFGLSGGSDTMLTYHLTAKGGRIVWCDEAEVDDLIPDDRLTREWVRRRIFRTSSSWSRITMLLDGHGTRVRADLVLRGLKRFTLGLPRWAAGLVLRRPAWQGRGAHDLISGRAMIVGAFGHVHFEYAR